METTNRFVQTSSIDGSNVIIMKLTYETTATLDMGQLFSIIKESIEAKTGKMLANIYWDETDQGMTAKLMFRHEEVDLTKGKS